MLKQLPVQSTKLTYAKATDTTNSKITCFPINKSTNLGIIKNIKPKQNADEIIYLKNNTNEANTENLKSLKKCVSLALNDAEVCFLSVNDGNGNFIVELSDKANKEKAEELLKNLSKLTEANYKILLQGKFLPKVIITDIPLGTINELPETIENHLDQTSKTLKRKKVHDSIMLKNDKIR